MVRKILVIMGLAACGLTVAGCAPLIGAGAVIVADDAAEREGGNLF